MALPTLLTCIFYLLSVSAFFTCVLSDPDITSDFIAPPDANGTFFTFMGLRNLSDSIPTSFKATKVSLAEFPPLGGQSVSFALLQFPPAGINPPHTHPRGTELLLLILGTMEVAFVDTKNVIYTQTLQTGDMFVFPKGMVHYQYNRNHQHPAVAVSAFGSASAGTVLMPSSVFGTGIDDVVLAKSFRTDVDTVRKIKSGLTQP